VNNGTAGAEPQKAKKARWIWLAGALVLLLLGSVTLSAVVDQPLRESMERKLNARLKGYAVHLGGVRLHPLGFALDLTDIVIVQEANPEPPVAWIPKLSASVQWRALFLGRVVADFLLDRPAVYLDLRHVRAEQKSQTPLRERGWQEALQAIYPLKINEFKIVEGDLTYVDEGPFRPLHLSRLNFTAENIRNIRSREREYPSDLYLEGLVFDTGTVRLEGNADFLAEPHVGVKARLDLEHVEVDYFKPIVSRYNIVLREGTLSGAGELEYAPRIKVVHLQKLTVENVQLDYVHKARTAVAEKRVAKKIVRKAQEVSNQPRLLLRADEVRITKSTFGFENQAADPPYRLYLAHAAFHLTNLSNHLSEGTAVGKLTGKLMNSGDVSTEATFRPETQGADFSLAVQIEQVQMPALNDLWRAYEGIDMAAGLFSFYTELAVRQHRISGYAKPVFQDLQVSDPRTEQQKGFMDKVKEKVIGGLAKVLENPRGEVSTKTDLSGTLDDPQTSTWQIILGLIQNAFFKAILPGFEHEVGRPGRK